MSSLPEALEAGAVAKGAKRWVMDAEEAARRAGTDGTVPAMSPADVEARLEDVAVASARLRAARLAALDGEARRREEERDAWIETWGFIAKEMQRGRGRNEIGIKSPHGSPPSSRRTSMDKKRSKGQNAA